MELANIKGYIEAPAKPDGFDQSLRLICGNNPHGEPMVRVEWGWNCRVFRNGNPNALAYGRQFLDRWILERWFAPEFFGTPEKWEIYRYFQGPDGKKVDCLGEYPRKGRYGMIMPIVAAGLHGTKAGDFLPLSTEILEMVAMKRADILAGAPTEHAHAKYYREFMEEMEAEEAAIWAEAEKEADIFADEIKKREDYINRNPEFSFANPNKPVSLWTPKGEVTL